MSRLVIASLVLLALVAGVLGFSEKAHAQAGVLPLMVINATNGPLGPVVGFNGGLGPDPQALVRIIDPTNNVPVIVNVLDKNSLATGNNRTFFSMTNCNGTVYHETGNEQGLTNITGFDHSIARKDLDAPGNQKLYASPASDAGSSTSYASQYVNSFCSGSDGGTKMLRTATEVLDIDAAHPPGTGYTLAMQ